ncbi:hypothetical protein [Streptomyces sp. SPB162]|uniref:hypothetical protein n=1 Tax=Streptomyces sp. SPB162 TaxID=2940560 RepID=UPI00240647BD|nr:hypothetical protein [Streptomyces sp. SPB162]MDF9817080.1 hypothetical protein [Streptomyces sp. SPB162]
MELGATDGEPSADHIVFRWAGNLGSSRGAGIAAVAQSGNERAARELADRLGPVLRVRGRGARPSLVRMKDGSQVVLLSRMPGVDANSRDSTVCHAIVGSSSLLRAKFCLALGAATPWQPSDWLETVKGKVDPLSQQTLRRTAAEWEPRLRRAVPLVARPLECLVAQFLRAPEGRVSALHGELVEAVAAAGASAPAPEGHPVGSALDPALVALWGLCDIFNSSLGQGGWSYATYDSLDSHHRVVFVPAWKGSPEEDARLQRIDLGDPGSDDHADRAHEMVADYCRWAVSGAGGPYPRYHGVSAPARVPPVDRSAASPYSPQQFSGPADMDARRDQEQARRQRVQEQNRYEDSGRRSPQESFTGRDGFERDGSEPYERDQARGTGPFSLYGQESEQGSRPVPEPERSRQSERAWGPPPAPPRRSGPRDAGRQQPSTAAPGRRRPDGPDVARHRVGGDRGAAVAAVAAITNPRGHGGYEGAGCAAPRCLRGVRRGPGRRGAR